MGMGLDHLTEADTVVVAAVEIGVAKAASQLGDWIKQARVRLIALLTQGVAERRRPSGAAISEPWSNCQSTWLNLVNRQMYRRAKLYLLGARPIGAA